MKLSNHSILFLAAGFYLLLGGIAGYATVNAAILLALGIYRFRTDRNKLAIVVMAVSTLVLIINQFVLFALIVLLSLGFYYIRSRPAASGLYRGAHRMFLNMRLDERSWVLQSMSYWQVVGEIRMDMTLAIPEDKETSIVLQGLVGDVDLTVPEDYGLEVEASVLIGQIGFRQSRDGGVLHRLSWRSPDYDRKEYRLKLQLFYLVGDIKIRTV
ncbi:cell wall-active antibiotics response protein LiaF [Cohnella caldifontis]|uniref:cell wall-active antibiotics response protein LiaF n=1 Tax=Cohnella caldifontis TaxID=3027471 RepID=UPI0023EBAE3B|nr:cell wall-active antibiotics response protein LiaF [Cohnella sp. YIM B05605]